MQLPYPACTIDLDLELKAISYLISDSSNFFDLVALDFSHATHQKIFKELLASQTITYSGLLALGLSENSALFVFEVQVYSSAEMARISKQLRQMTLARKKIWDMNQLYQKISSCTPSELQNVVWDITLRQHTYDSSKMREKLKNEVLPERVYYYPNTLSNLTEYFSPGWICVIAASMGVGKTLTAVQIVRSISQMENSISMYVSLEMPLVSYLERCLTIKYYENPDSDWWGWQKLRKNLTMDVLIKEAISENEIVIDKPGMTVSQIREQVRKAIASGVNLKTVIIDHFHILRPEISDKSKEENQSQDKKMMDLDAMAKELNVRVLLLCQTRKAKGDNRFEEPFDSDIRGTKLIVDQSWWVLMLWRDKDNENVLNYKLAKRRDGYGVGTKGKIPIRGTYLYDESSLNFNPGNY